jgi:hypothetical protein
MRRIVLALLYVSSVSTEAHQNVHISKIIFISIELEKFHINTLLGQIAEATISTTNLLADVMSKCFTND